MVQHKNKKSPSFLFASKAVALKQDIRSQRYIWKYKDPRVVIFIPQGIKQERDRITYEIPPPVCFNTRFQFLASLRSRPHSIFKGISLYLNMHPSTCLVLLPRTPTHSSTHLTCHPPPHTNSHPSMYLFIQHAYIYLSTPPSTHFLHSTSVASLCQIHQRRITLFMYYMLFEYRQAEVAAHLSIQPPAESL